MTPRKLKAQRGASLVEFSILCAAVVLVCVISLSQAGSSANQALAYLSDGFDAGSSTESFCPYCMSGGGNNGDNGFDSDGLQGGGTATTLPGGQGDHGDNGVEVPAPDEETDGQNVGEAGGSQDVDQGG